MCCPPTHATDRLHNCHPTLHSCTKVAAFVNHMMMCIMPQSIRYVISILHLQFHSLYFYEAYISLKNRLVKPKVHENIKVASKSV